MGKWAIGITSIVAAVAVAAILVLRVVVLPNLDADMNTVDRDTLWPVSQEAQALHDTLRVADLHADTLLWARNPSRRHEYGHTDLPRFRQGRVVLQVFTAVTKSPPGLNYEENNSTADDITTLAMAQGWPLDTWGSLEARARYQARRLTRVAAREPDFWLVKSKADLDRLLTARGDDAGALGGILGTEGSHPLEGDITAIDRLFDEGYRVMGLQHFFDNELGGSLHGVSKAGLTPFGREAIARMEEREIVIDIAHSSEAVAREVIEATTRPLIVSHTGIQSLCDTPRNVADDILADVARRGGLIGIGFWDDAVCDATPRGLARTIRAGIDLFGEDAIALGSDFDGTVSTYFDVGDMAVLTHALLAEGVSERQIRKVMGENQIAFFAKWLPEE